MQSIKNHVIAFLSGVVSASLDKCQEEYTLSEVLSGKFFKLNFSRSEKALSEER